MFRWFKDRCRVTPAVRIDRRGDMGEIASNSLAVSIRGHEKTEPFCTKTGQFLNRA